MKKQIKSIQVHNAYKKKSNKLTPRESDIITRYYGLGGWNVYTQRELAETYQVTTERIRQLRMIALNKLGVPPK